MKWKFSFQRYCSNLPSAPDLNAKSHSLRFYVSLMITAKYRLLRLRSWLKVEVQNFPKNVRISVFTIINEHFTIISLKLTIIRSFGHHWEAAPTVMYQSILKAFPSPIWKAPWNLYDKITFFASHFTFFCPPTSFSPFLKFFPLLLFSYFCTLIFLFPTFLPFSPPLLNLEKLP